MSELVALSKTLPRHPGYVSFVNESRFLPGRSRILREQGVVVFVRESDGTGGLEFPFWCNFQKLKDLGHTKGWVPKWFVPAGRGRALLRVKPTEYKTMPLGEFKYKTCEPNYQYQDEVIMKDFFRHAEGIRDGLFDNRTSSDFKGEENNFNDTLRAIYAKIASRDFPFEVGDWVYVPLNGGELQTKAQIQLTKYDFDPNCCVVRLEPFLAEDATGKSKLLTSGGVQVIRKSLVTQRAFPPVPYESKRGIGAKYDPTPYINLDWE